MVRELLKSAVQCWLCVALKTGISLDDAMTYHKHLLDTPRSSVWVSQARRALAQKFALIFWCEGTALAIGTWVF